LKKGKAWEMATESILRGEARESGKEEKQKIACVRTIEGESTRGK